MIGQLKGLVGERDLDEAVIDVSGVGYRVRFSMLTLMRLPDMGQPVTVRVRTVVREDAFDLYGFLSREEEELFLMLTSVSQVGPSLALKVLSGMEVEELIGAMGRGEVARLTKIHGVGKKTAERLVLELKDKVKVLALPAGAAKQHKAPMAAPKDDLVSALIHLGYKEPQAEAAAQAVAESLGREAPFEAQFKEALKALRS
ncbi:MAG: Holliday junction branch migration protein RuvA [Myxococcaceae bacterium]|nr:Holliday junction branch migration protein RuvA [Myxococcaceae bacterium]